jgi:ABC-type sugar transport system substrate-binding protein
MNYRAPLSILISLLGWLLVSGCGRDGGDADTGLTVGVSFESLETEFWAAGVEAIEAELADRGIEALTSIADGDPSRQLQQIRVFISRKVDGIILVPKDLQTSLPAIKAANAAGIPVVLFNRPAATGPDARAVSVVADNRRLTQQTVSYLIEQARARGGEHEAMVVIGDLGDNNAVARRDGFFDAIAGHEDMVKVVAEVPSEWTQEKARAGVTNALQANPNIRLIFSSSDFLFPSIVAALKAADRYHPIGHPDHVILGGFDGDASAYQMLKEGYLDATGVQDLYFEAAAAVQAIVDLRAGKEVPDRIMDPGFVIHQNNLDEMAGRMWGAQVSR